MNADVITAIVAGVPAILAAVTALIVAIKAHTTASNTSADLADHLTPSTDKPTNDKLN